MSSVVYQAGQAPFLEPTPDTITNSSAPPLRALDQITGSRVGMMLFIAFALRAFVITLVLILRLCFASCASSPAPKTKKA